MVQRCLTLVVEKGRMLVIAVSGEVLVVIRDYAILSNSIAFWSKV